MKKKITFDNKKYIKVSVWKMLALLAGMFLLFFIVSFVKNTKLNSNEFGYLMLLIFVFELFYFLKLSINYKNYKDYFSCQYNNNIFIYNIVRFPYIIETLFNFNDNKTFIHVEISHIKHIEKKMGRIVITGNVTIEKKVHKTKITNAKVYSFPDYCIGEEQLIEMYTKK